jgi:trk system potassium uptake protein TrkA
MARTNAKQEFAVIGLGQFGASLALNLEGLGHSVLALDRDPDLVQSLADDLTQTVALDATDEQALRAVGIDSFHTAVVAIGADFESSVLITVLLKELGLQRVICKALTERQKAVLLRIGADRVILPEHEAGEHLAGQLAAPHVVDWMELEPGINLTQFRVPEGWVGRSLRQLDLTSRFGIIVLAAKGARTRAAPRADEVLQRDDTLIVMGPDESIAALETWDPDAG